MAACSGMDSILDTGSRRSDGKVSYPTEILWP